MTAKEMSNLAAANKQVKGLHYTPIMRKILNAARMGRFSITYEYLLVPEELQELRANGYFVRYEEDKFHYVINW